MMQLKKGFKQTEIGIFPEDWEIKTFADFVDRNVKWSITGGPFGSNLKTSDYTDDGIQIIQLQNIGDGIFHNDSKVYTSKEKANELIGCNIYPGEIILSKMGDPVARACFIPHLEKRYLMASDGIRLVVNEKEFSKRFVHDYINSIYFRKRAFEVSKGSTRLRIGLPELKKILIIKPSLKEQTAIATALSDADALISSLEKLIEKKRNIKQGAMQQLLKPKKGWVVKKLGKYCEFYSGGTPSTSNSAFYGGDIKWITSSDLNMTQIDEVSGRITTSGLANSSAQMVKEGTLLVALYGATAGVTAITNINAAINQAVLAIIPKEDDTKFLFYCLTHLKSWIISTFIQGGQGNLSGNIFKDLELPFPSYSEQNEIATILSDMDNEITSLEKKLSKSKMLKQGMMQELLTGKIRII